MFSAEECLNRLKIGNKRYVQGNLECNVCESRRLELKDHQSPFATILGCSDSRVPIELIFNQGLGNLFIVRTAGNIIDEISLGSLEYGGTHCNTPLMIVLGHQNCGAVTAAVRGKPLPGSMQKIEDNIAPVVNHIENNNLSFEQLVEKAIRENIKRVLHEIKDKSELLRKRISEGKLKLIGAYYSFDSGGVEFLE